MKNKKLIIILISLAIITLIPISVLAINNLNMRIMVVEEEPINKEELLKEKAQYSNNIIQQNNSVSVYNNQEDIELTKKLNEASKKAKEIENIIINVMNKFYPNEFTKIKEQLYATTNNNQANLKIELYNLILNVLERESLTNEESNTLKEFMISQTYEIMENDELQKRFTRICSK